MELNHQEILDQEIKKHPVPLNYSSITMNKHAALSAMQEVESQWRQKAGELRAELGEHLETSSRFPAIALIAAERRRQVEGEGWMLEHDDQHSVGELAMAAMCYCMDPVWRPAEMAPMGWPWVGSGEMDGFKPSPGDRVRELVKAGALIAAEIERLLRAEKEVLK